MPACSGRCGEIWGDVGRSGEICWRSVGEGDARLLREMWGDLGRCGEICWRRRCPPAHSRGLCTIQLTSDARVGGVRQPAREVLAVSAGGASRVVGVDCVSLQPSLSPSPVHPHRAAQPDRLTVHRRLATTTASPRLARAEQQYGRYGEIWGDMGRYGEIWGDLGRSGEIWGDRASHEPSSIALVELSRKCLGSV